MVNKIYIHSQLFNDIMAKKVTMYYLANADYLAVGDMGIFIEHDFDLEKNTNRFIAFRIEEILCFAGAVYAEYSHFVFRFQT